MKHIIVGAAIFLASALAQAAGLPFAVESLSKARQIAQQDGKKHVLIFYTSEN